MKQVGFPNAFLIRGLHFNFMWLQQRVEYDNLFLVKNQTNYINLRYGGSRIKILK